MSDYPLGTEIKFKHAVEDITLTGVVNGDVWVMDEITDEPYLLIPVYVNDSDQTYRVDSRNIVEN